MGAEAWKAGDRAVYKGIMANRQGQTIEVVSVGGLIACRFPDGAVIGCASHSLRRGA